VQASQLTSAENTATPAKTGESQILLKPPALDIVVDPMSNTGSSHSGSSLQSETGEPTPNKPGIPRSGSQQPGLPEQRSLSDLMPPTPSPILQPGATGRSFPALSLSDKKTSEIELGGVPRSTEGAPKKDEAITGETETKEGCCARVQPIIFPKVYKKPRTKCQQRTNHLLTLGQVGFSSYWAVEAFLTVSNPWLGILYGVVAYTGVHGVGSGTIKIISMIAGGHSKLKDHDAALADLQSENEKLKQRAIVLEAKARENEKLKKDFELLKIEMHHNVEAMRALQSGVKKSVNAALREVRSSSVGSSSNGGMFGPADTKEQGSSEAEPLLAEQASASGNQEKATTAKKLV